MPDCQRKEGVLRDSRGVSMVLVAITMVALLSATALAIDIGMLLNARTEAQRAADAAALAGAGSLITFPQTVFADAEAKAQNKAIEYGALNTVTDIPVTLLPEDVDVDLAQERVTVTVRRVGVRGTAVGTWFANVFGVSEVDVEARAAAEAQPSGAARCVKPFSIYDYFNDVNDNGEWDDGIDQYDPALHGYGSTWRNFGQPGYVGPPNYVNDWGRPITIKGNSKKGDPCCPGTGPSWYYPWDIPQIDGGPASGANRYRWNIANCNPSTVYVGEPYDKENGNMWGPTVQGVEDLIAKDPGAHWVGEENGYVAGSAWGDNWEASPRIGIVPTFDPGLAFEPGKKEYEFTNFMAVFIEGVTGNGNNQQVHGRILYATGVAGGEDPGATVKFIRLVE